jgi:hypothetical protein
MPDHRTTSCGATYTTRDGGSTLVCTEPKGHPAGGLDGTGHYAGGWDYDRILCAQHGCTTYTTPTLYYCRAHYARQTASGAAGHRHAGRTITTRHGDLVECRSCGQVVPASEVAV